MSPLPALRRPRYLLPGLPLLALAALAVALFAGPVAVDAGTIWRAVVTGEGPPATRIVAELRLPRALTAFVVGGSLALAGALMQVLLRNPLADPYVLGVSGGAAVAALATLLMGLGSPWVSTNAFVGALASMLLVFGIAHGRGSWTTSRLLLTGIVVASGWGAVVMFLLAVSPDERLRGMVFWLMGDLSSTAGPGWTAALLLTGVAVAFGLARPLNLLTRGDLRARALGVPVRRLRLGIYALASLLTAAAVTVAGTVGFVGLVVPHILRLLGGADHRWLVPASVLGGGTLLVFADALARTVLAPQQLPVGVLTALLGVPLFLLLLHRGPQGPSR
ncbi:MAG: ABC transporter permease [Proteobacteria bacterium SW_6_67_9]|nr:MAG: ABC transporter permease [Proteobacteria bacterium SW_6_67_9]